MVRKICPNPLCELGRSSTHFGMDEDKCPLCKSKLKLRDEVYNLNDKSLQEYEEYVNDLFSAMDPSSEEVKDFIKYYNFIGSEWACRSEFDKALFYLQKALEICKTTNDIPNVAIETIFNNIADVLADSGQAEKAIDYYALSLAIQKKCYGPEHMFIAWTYNKIAHEFFTLGDFDKSVEFYHKSLKIVIKSTDYEDLIKLYINLGNALLKIMKIDDANLCFEKALELGLYFFKTNNPIMGYIYCALGESCSQQGNFVKATYYHKKELNVALKTMQGMNLAFFYWKVAQSYLNLKNYTLAIENFRKGFKLTNYTSGGFPFNIGKCYAELNNLSKAMHYYLSAAEVRMKELGLNAKETIEAVEEYNKLAELLGKPYLELNSLLPN